MTPKAGPGPNAAGRERKCVAFLVRLTSAVAKAADVDFVVGHVTIVRQAESDMTDASDVSIACHCHGPGLAMHHILLFTF